MPKGIIIADIMNRNTTSILYNRSLEEACQLFVKEQCHYFPVVNDADELVGVLSTLDVLSIAIDYIENGKRNSKKKNTPLKVEDLMKRDPFRIQADAAVQQALDIFENEQCWALLVLSGNTLVGIVTSFDLVNYFTHQSRYSVDL
ncbi:MAG: hypothetical protein DHS20C18_23150 [Saprospiraceae bacterium]|nr:MAG: hypothetical protein DHS20C18_23150 [Saprospiraceae bacterium]